MSDPKLVAAMEQIKAILKGADVMGLVILGRGEEAEYLVRIAEPDGPSWSCLQWEMEGERLKGIRLKAKGRRDHAERFKINWTVKFLFTARDVLALMYDTINNLCTLVEENMHVELGERRHEPSSRRDK